LNSSVFGDLRRHHVALDRAESEAREVVLGSHREQIEGTEPPFLRPTHHAAHERLPEAVRAPLRPYRDRAQERRVRPVAADLEAGHRGQLARPAGVIRDHEVVGPGGEQVSDAGARQVGGGEETLDGREVAAVAARQGRGVLAPGREGSHAGSRHGLGRAHAGPQGRA
jgi:hypothetical protein